MAGYQRDALATLVSFYFGCFQMMSGKMSRWLYHDMFIISLSTAFLIFDFDISLANVTLCPKETREILPG